MEEKRTTVVEQPAKQMPDMKTVVLKMSRLRLHASGKFSNVYRGTLRLPDGDKEIAIKKTWPESIDRNFEMVFLTGIDRPSHKNIIHMLYAFSNRAKDGKICESYVFEYIPDTLDSLIQRTNIQIIDITLYTFQLFHALKYLASESIVHRDIKPENILVDHEKGTLQISDFGSAKILRAGQPSIAYQVTRFYRPPDLLLGSMYYTCGVDVWSAGCVMGEMLKRHKLFPGRDNRHQLRLIFAALGIPTQSDLHAMKSPTKLTNDIEINPTGLASLLPDAPNDAVKLLEKILVYNPKKRICGSVLLTDPFFEVVTKGLGKRPNGKPISSIINAVDVRDAFMKEKKPRYYHIADKKVHITFSSDCNQPTDPEKGTDAKNMPKKTLSFKENPSKEITENQLKKQVIPETTAKEKSHLSTVK